MSQKVKSVINCSLCGTIFLYEDESIARFLHLHLCTIQRISCFGRSNLCFEIAIVLFFLYCGGNKSSTAINLVLISKFFQSFSSEGKFISCQSYLPMNGFFFAIVSGCFPIFLRFNGTVLTYLKKLSSSMFLSFLCNPGQKVVNKFTE